MYEYETTALKPVCGFSFLSPCGARISMTPDGENTGERRRK